MSVSPHSLNDTDAIVLAECRSLYSRLTVMRLPESHAARCTSARPDQRGSNDQCLA
jgi:hypothetical protein